MFRGEICVLGRGGGCTVSCRLLWCLLFVYLGGGGFVCGGGGRGKETDLCVFRGGHS